MHQGRFTDKHSQDFYDINWNRTDFEQPGLPLATKILDKPIFLEKMLDLSRRLAKDIPHIRVDWYYVNGRLYFGELTFFDGSGFGAFKEGQDELLGSWIRLPDKT